jgi:hypothetical protein
LFFYLEGRTNIGFPFFSATGMVDI